VGRDRRHRRVRKKVIGTTERPRLCVFRSGKHIYAQIINDEVGRCMVTVSSLSPDVKSQLKGKENKTAISVLVGKTVAEKAKGLGVEAVAFDRGGYLYHGRVKALADGAREAGLKF
jgi:large subunit ribosomal protein L18